MANNVPITNGQGQSSVAAEDISNVKYQQIKVVDGTTSSTNKWVINSDGTAQVSVVGTINVAGSVAAIITGSPSISGAVTITGTPSISGTVNIGDIKQSIFGASIVGTVPFTQSGTLITSIVSSIPSSVLVGASIFGQLPAGTAPLGSVAALQGTNPWVVVGSVYGIGSTVSFQGGAPWAVVNVGSIISTNIGSIITKSIGSVITVWNDSSVLSVPVGSTIAVLQTPSIVGTFSEDAAHAIGAKGLFTLGVRNDTLASVTSADNDYTLMAVGPSGENITANAPLTKWIRGTADLRTSQGASVTAIAAQGASVFTYITGIQVANMGSASVLVTLGGGLGSILGYTIAPAGGGSNINYPNALKTGENSAFTASISGTASVLVSMQGFTAKV